MGYATDFPAYGQVRASNELRKVGTFVSPSGVRSIWLRHNLASMKTRLAALEKKSAEEGLVLTEAQVEALERKKHDDIACGEIETAHPGYLGNQDTFYVGTIKGVGRIYQQTYVDTYFLSNSLEICSSCSFLLKDSLNTENPPSKPKSIPPQPEKRERTLLNLSMIILPKFLTIIFLCRRGLAPSQYFRFVPVSAGK